MVGLISDIGKKRVLNEDYAEYIISEGYSLFIVADGMGGHNAGEVASKLAVDSVIKYFDDNWNSSNAEEVLGKAVKYSNKKVFNYSRYSGKLKGMGTTITLALATPLRIYVANVGDSSCFLLKEDKLIKVTRDHSLVQELLDIGSITEEEATNHPKKNIITRAIGIYEDVDVDIYTLPNFSVDKYILCSDGLTNEVTLEEIAYFLRKYNNEEAAKQLVTLANKREGRDNITVLVFGGEL